MKTRRLYEWNILMHRDHFLINNSLHVDIIRKNCNVKSITGAKNRAGYAFLLLIL